MVVVVLLSRYFKINPDNVATPIAASLGDLVTLTLLAWVSNLLFQAIGECGTRHEVRDYVYKDIVRFISLFSRSLS